MADEVALQFCAYDQRKIDLPDDFWPTQTRKANGRVSVMTEYIACTMWTNKLKLSLAFSVLSNKFKLPEFKQEMSLTYWNSERKKVLFFPLFEGSDNNASCNGSQWFERTVDYTQVCEDVALEQTWIFLPVSLLRKEVSPCLLRRFRA